MNAETKISGTSHDQFILMADIIGSRTKEQNRLMSDFMDVTKTVNKKHGNWFLSPITITLGDEFQCIAQSLISSVQIIFEIEEQIIKREKDFKLKYVLVEGEIDTPLNKKIAYGMMGSGLTRARESLISYKKSRSNRFWIDLKNERTSLDLNLAFFIYQSFVDEWKVKKDYYIVSKFLEKDDYKEVAEDINKNRSLMWKRGNSLKIKQYKAIKNLIIDIAKEWE